MDEDVIKLDVSVNNVLHVQEVQGEEELLNDDFSLWLSKAALFLHGLE